MPHDSRKQQKDISVSSKDQFKDRLDTLPFVSTELKGWQRFWAVNRSGDWSRDNGLGRDYARQFIAFLRETGACNVLAAVVMAMPRGDDLGAVEIGFLTYLAANL